ncbi:2Fe-2S iron-sulfur cluster-binding protein [Candidatus Sororendozoicomonas aggregata]|uniref:2Fe-2S iron-sulfur cluster-binding protein n=1 Tax=Candidatus Sororendozoicomonas aggregata TaxID=3073239 RepID=UPI002ECFCB01
MPEIIFSQKTCLLEQGDNLLEGLLQQGIKVPHSCRAGVCHSCLLQLTEGIPPDGSQTRLTSQQIKKRYILACQSVVCGNLHLQPIVRDEIPASVAHIEKIAPTCVCLHLSPRFPFIPSPDKASSTVRIIINAEIAGECTVDGIEQEGMLLFFQIERKAGDAFSIWAHDLVSQGDQVLLQIL